MFRNEKNFIFEIYNLSNVISLKNSIVYLLYVNNVSFNIVIIH